MTKLLTPDELQEIEGRNRELYEPLRQMAIQHPKQAAHIPLAHETDVRALLRDREAICERLEGMALHHESKAKVWRVNNDIQRGKFHRDFADELRAFVSELRGGK